MFICYSICCAELIACSLRTEYCCPFRLAESRCRLDKRVQHRLQIESRAADDLEHVGGRDLLIGEWADLAAIDGDHTEHVVLLDHRHVDQCPDAAKFDRSNQNGVAVEIGLLRTQVRNLDWLPGLDGVGNGDLRVETEHSS